MIERHITIDVPESRRVVVELPAELPVGPAKLEIRVLFPGDEPVEVPIPEIDVSQMPRYLDKRTGEWRLVERSGVVRVVS